MKKLIISSLSFLFLASALSTQALAQANLKIGVVNMLYVINESVKGKQSKQLIESQVKQTTDSLKKKKQEIDIIQNELQTSMILSDSAKRDKQTQVQRMIQDFQQEQAEKEKSFRNLEREKTELIFQEVQKIVQKMAVDKQLDLVIESQIAAGFLYARNKSTDITEEVLTAYDKASK